MEGKFAKSARVFERNRLKIAKKSPRQPEKAGVSGSVFRDSLKTSREKWKLPHNPTAYFFKQLRGL
jgi:hypothetical protein